MEDVTCKLSLGKLVLQSCPRDVLVRGVTSGIYFFGHSVGAEVGLALLLLPADLGREAEGRDEVRNVVVVLVQAANLDIVMLIY